jgi:hypothetical protein
MRVSEIIEGSLKISATSEGYVVTFTPYAVKHSLPGELRLPNRQAVADFIQEIGTRSARMIGAMDDLRETGVAFLPTVFLTPGQRERFHS